MRCWRIDLWRKYTPYLDGELTPQTVQRIEAHLLDCGGCRTRLAHLQQGQRFAKHLSRLTPERDPWTGIETAIETHPVAAVKGTRARPTPTAGWWTRLKHPAVAGWVLASALLLVNVFFLSDRGWFSNRGNVMPGTVAAFELESFRTVKISEIDRNTEPHIVMEGYVSEIQVDHEDGDLVFKLVENPRQLQPFIVCEIINPIRLTPPAVGSRVRVYGVSRYDNQTNHRWYEVHPVLSIEPVKR